MRTNKFKFYPLKCTNLRWLLVVIIGFIQLQAVSQNQTSQNYTVSGVVTSKENGEPLPGVNVILKNSSVGAITDFDGVYSISAPGDGVLIYSSIGFVAEEVPVNLRKVIDVSMTADVMSLEEIVVVGYGTQKKINLTGSVSSINSSEIVERPQQNVMALLQGKAAGLQISSNSGRPGREGINTLVRGMGSYGTNNQPLMIIDGVPGSVDVLNPEDIEAISVLKDAASASIYGSRAANGVILITTKRGKEGTMNLTYNTYASIQQPTFLGDQIWNSAQYMELWNQLADRHGGRTKYSQELIDKYKDPNKDRIKYPDFNWMEGTFGNGYLISHNLNVNGGSEKLTYNISFGFQDQQGIVSSDKYKKYTGVVNAESKIKEWLNLGLNIKLFKGEINESYFNDENGMPLLAVTNAPMYRPYLPDGSGRYAQLAFPLTLGGTGVNRNATAMRKETERLNENYTVNPQFYGDVTVVKSDIMSLISHTQASFSFSENFGSYYYPAAIPFYYYLKESDYMAGGADEYMVSNPSGSPANLGVGNTWSRNISTNWFSTLNFDWDINEDHSMSALVGYQEETANSRFLSGSRRIYPTSGMKEINGGSVDGQSLSGNLSSEVALRSIFGRIKYSYKDRYLIEGNFRTDGTSRLAPSARWGTFPSISAAWRVSEEDFIKNNINWVDDLKLRGSWGNLGNSEVGSYPYQEVYNVGNYIFGGAPQLGALNSSYRDPNLQWEKTTVTDIGLDMTLARGLFGLTFDWYNKTTTGILAGLPVPASLGLNGPIVNYGEMRNQGVEIEVSHKNQIGDFGYGLNFQASYNKNELLKVRTPSYGTYIVEEGLPYRSYYLYQQEGIFQSEEDILNHATQPYENPKPGDIYYKDINGDGVVDQDDRQVTDGVYPKVIYSSTINLSYKNFDLNAFFQGITGKTQLAWQWVVDPFTTGGPPSEKFLDAWTPENTDTNVPALYYSGYGPMNYMSTYYLENSSYLRLKNLQIGYNFPQTVLSTLKLQGLRIYLSGENLFTITKYGYGMDPENDQGKTDTVVKYPQLKSFSAGVRLTL